MVSDRQGRTLSTCVAYAGVHAMILDQKSTRIGDHQKPGRAMLTLTIDPPSSSSPASPCAILPLDFALGAARKGNISYAP
jgi:hypothetical protein